MNLVDTSVWARKDNPRVRDWFNQALVVGDLAICDLVAMEILQGVAQSQRYWETLADLRGVPWFAMGQFEWRRALEVSSSLERQGGQLRRSVKIADLLIAAAAERADVDLVHYDRDFDTIASVTGQPSHWVVPPGVM